MAREDWQELEHHKAAAEADALAGRIRALDNVLGSTTDPTQAATLRAQLVELQVQWEASVTKRDRIAEGVPPPPKGNGDIDALKQQVVALGKAVASDKPDEAHAIITASIDALTRMDARLGHVEARVTAIEHHIHPPLVVRFWQVAALCVLLFGGTLFWWKDSRDVLFGVVPWAGVLVEAVLVILVAACLRLAYVELKGDGQ